MYDDGHTSLIIDHDALRESYMPDKLKAREAQREQILCCLSPVVEKHKPIHAWLYGKPGTGKTTTALHALKLLEERGDLQVFSCMQENT
ncbi:MAG: hypothetical protein ACYS18_12660 [Planctomycetota bacterium]